MLALYNFYLFWAWGLAGSWVQGLGFERGLQGLRRGVQGYYAELDPKNGVSHGKKSMKIRGKEKASVM